MEKTRAEQIIDLWKGLKGERSNFESYWQSLHDYYYIEAEDINRAYYPGTELTVSSLYDSTSLEAADVLASGFMNYLTPPTSKWFSLRSRNPELRDNRRVTSYLEDVAEQVNYSLNRSNFYNQIVASYKSSGVYGTSAMLEEDDDNDDIRFFSIPIKSVCLVEDSRGKVCKYIYEYEFTAFQAVDKFGEDNVSREIKEEFTRNVGSNKKHPFLLFVADRYRRDINKTDKKNMPIEAVWVDVGGKMVVEESGYHEFPSMCHRFDKRPFIPWGYSPAMKALPFARILNAVAKTNLRSMMKHTDPPIAVPDDAFVMPLDANPRAINYYNPKVIQDARSSIFSFGNTGDPNVGMMAIQYYQQKVKSMMFNDTFLAFDNITKQMNNPEVMERINEKMTMLGPAVGRYISEMINPIIVRTIGILYRKNKLPMPPDEMIMDPGYEIDCISQLAQSQRRSELNALTNGLALVGQMAQYAPEVLDNIDSDKVVEEAWGIMGAPSRVMRDDEGIKILRDERGRVAQMNMAMNMAKQGADAAEVGSKVEKNMAEVQEKNSQ